MACLQLSSSQFPVILPLPEDASITSRRAPAVTLCRSPVAEGLPRHCTLIYVSNQAFAGFPDPLRESPRLDLALKGLRRRKPRTGDTRLPITLWVLSIIGQSLAQHYSGYDQALLWAACCTGFFAFMRSGELTIPEGVQFDPARHLTPLDVAVDSRSHRTAIRIHLKSKTDVT